VPRSTIDTEQTEEFPTNTEMEMECAAGKPSTVLDQERDITKQMVVTNKGKTPDLEHFHIPGSLGNSLSWGDQPIMEHVDEVVDVQEITCDIKIQVIVTRPRKKRRVTLDSALMITMEETLLDTR
jgi:hypothetical protein